MFFTRLFLAPPQAFVYSTRERLTDDDMERHANETERDNLMARVNEAGEWMESEEAETATTVT